jgi:hypothetical protein
MNKPEIIWEEAAMTQSTTPNSACMASERKSTKKYPRRGAGGGQGPNTSPERRRYTNLLDVKKNWIR